MSPVRFCKDLVLQLIQVPANLVAALAIEHPALTGKFFPFASTKLCLVLPQRPPPIAPGPDGLPVPPRRLWENYAENPDHYLRTGRTDVDNMRAILRQSGFQFEANQRIFELGCATGRMLRWLQPEARTSQVWGADIKAEYITWCQQYLAPPFHFLTVTTLPHLPFPDGYFDFLYAGSVFTHISDLADTWLLELKRVLKPRGFMYITIHDNHTIDLLRDKSRQSPLALILFAYSRKIQPFDPNFGMCSVRRSPNGAQVFYHIDFIRRKLEALFKVHSITPEAYGHQTGILLENQ